VALIRCVIGPYSPPLRHRLSELNVTTSSTSSSSPSSSSLSGSELSYKVQEYRQERHKDRHLYRSLSQNRRRSRAGQRANLWMSRHYLSTNNTIARRIQLEVEKRIIAHNNEVAYFKAYGHGRLRKSLKAIEDEPITPH
jgi:hypothetical protein